MDANSLRNAFTQFFVDRGHSLVPSAGLIPHHPAAPLFTNAGMNQFLPYFLGEEAAPFPRATTAQKCVRIRGKHDDIELIGRTSRHHTFFEMLGNFSFGDYFKEGAIKFHWELFTEVLKMDGDRVWVTVHTDDDAAADIWRDTIGIPPERIQRMSEDNFWEMGDTGPCGPCSELYFDKGSEFGEPGGPAVGSEERFMEFGNLVFMEFDRQTDGTLEPLPKQNIDTGSGFERILSFLQNQRSVWETDVIRPVIAAGESLSGTKYGSSDEDDVSLRIMADHGRSMTFLVSDGVFPSNEDRGYVLRRIVRRMLRHAGRIGAGSNVTTTLVSAVCDVMGHAYPEIVKNKDFVIDVLEREEHRYRQTVQAGTALLEEALASSDVVPGDTAFKLHDTFGFPIELTKEIAAERSKGVDVEGFEKSMERQRQMARERAKKTIVNGVATEAYRKIVDEIGATKFLAYELDAVDTRIVEVLEPKDSETIEVFLESSPFYAEQGGQVGDTGIISTDTGTATVIDTTWAVPGLIRHVAKVTDGRIEPGVTAHVAIDVERREDIRRNHTGTHILHWALREVLGTHVKQAGSLVAPDRLRFDFSHFGAVTQDEIIEVERLANREVIGNGAVEVINTTMKDATERGAIAFFGEKYGENVRMLQAGKHSLELCGGTHVSALGYIGPIKITSEASIGSNLRRIEAVTGRGALEYIAREEGQLRSAAATLNAKPGNLTEALDRAMARQKESEDELKALRTQARKNQANELAQSAVDGVVIERMDGIGAGDLRDIAVELRSNGAIRAVVLIGTPDGKSVSLVAATKKGGPIEAGSLIASAARAVGGGGGKGSDMAVAGGRDVGAIDEAIAEARTAAASHVTASA